MQKLTTEDTEFVEGRVDTARQHREGAPLARPTPLGPPAGAGGSLVLACLPYSFARVERSPWSEILCALCALCSYLFFA